MEKEQIGTIKGSVYITVHKFFNPVHISMKGTGEEGFQEFMPLQEGDNEDYLQRLEKAMDEHGIELQRYQRLSEVVYCL